MDLASQTLLARRPGCVAAPVALCQNDMFPPETLAWLQTDLTFTFLIRFFGGHSALDEMWELPSLIFLENFSSRYLRRPGQSSAFSPQTSARLL